MASAGTIGGKGRPARIWNDVQPLSEQIDWTRFTHRPAPPTGFGEDALAGRRVLITGAGGSIGSALARHIAGARPARLVLLDQAEEGLADLARDLLPSMVVPAVADVRDRGALDMLFKMHRPELIFHAAAYKHVPLMEANPFAAIETNAFGTVCLLQAAGAAGCQHLVVLSTDKAVAPRSIMGAAKRIAEIAALSAEDLPVSVLRLGNVLGSSGSLAPLLWRQIARGMPLTLTHPEARRYFITSEEAVYFLLAALADSAETRLWVPAMGEQRRIVELAAFLQELARVLEPLPVVYTGLRPGDKLREDLLGANEQASSPQSRHGLQAVQTPLPALSGLDQGLRSLKAACTTRRLPALLEAVHLLVPEYQPSSGLQAGLTDAPAEDLQ